MGKTKSNGPLVGAVFLSPPLPCLDPAAGLIIIGFRGKLFSGAISTSPAVNDGADGL